MNPLNQPKPESIGPSDLVNRIQSIHQWYQDNGLNCRLMPEWERRWLAWLKQGYTLDDLKLVVGYLRRQIRRGDRNFGALKLSNLLDLDPDGQFARFDEDLALAKADAFPRRPRPAPALETAEEQPPQATDEQRQAFARQLAEHRKHLRFQQEDQ